MALEKSEAILLKSYNWAESSRTVVFFSDRFGKIALIDKGGRSMKSKRGRLVNFCRYELTFYHSEKETSGYISDIELIKSYALDQNGSLGRLAYASAGSELLLMLLPEEEAQSSLYRYFINFIEQMEKADKTYLPAVFITFYLRILSQMGYHPSIAYCAGCGKEVSRNSNAQVFNFSPERGGMICSTCQTVGDYYISLSDASYRLLVALQTASLNEAATLPISLNESSRFADALSGFLGHQLGKKVELKSLAFIDKLKK